MERYKTGYHSLPVVFGRDDFKVPEGPPLPALSGDDSRNVSGCSSSAGTACLLTHRATSVLGDDTLESSSGNETFDSSSGADIFESSSGDDTFESSSGDDTFESSSRDDRCIKLERKKILAGRKTTLKRRKTGIALLKICQEAFPVSKEDKLPKLLQSYFREHDIIRKTLLGESSPESSLCNAFKLERNKINEQIAKNGEMLRKEKEEINKGYEELEAEDKNLKSFLIELVKSQNNKPTDCPCATNNPSVSQHETLNESKSANEKISNLFNQYRENLKLMSDKLLAFYGSDVISMKYVLDSAKIGNDRVLARFSQSLGASAIKRQAAASIEIQPTEKLVKR